MSNTPADTPRDAWLECLNLHLQACYKKGIPVQDILTEAGLRETRVESHVWSSICDYPYLIGLAQNPPPAKTNQRDHQLLCLLLRRMMFGKEALDFEDQVTWSSCTSWILEKAERDHGSRISVFKMLMTISCLLTRAQVGELYGDVRVENFMPMQHPPKIFTNRWTHYIYALTGFQHMVQQEARIKEDMGQKAQETHKEGEEEKPDSSPESKKQTSGDEAPAAPKAKRASKAKTGGPEPKDKGSEPSGVRISDVIRSKGAAVRPELVSGSIFAEPSFCLRFGTWNTQGLRIADNPEALEHLKNYVMGFDFFLLQEIGAEKGLDRLALLADSLPDGWDYICTKPKGQSQGNAIIKSPDWSWVTKDGTYLKTPLGVTGDASNKFPHAPIMAVLAHKSVPNLVVAVTCLHTSPSGSANGNSNPETAELGKTERLRAEVNDTLTCVFEKLKEWNVPYNLTTASDLMRKHVPLIVVGGDFNLYPGTTHNEPGVKSLIPPKDDSDVPLNNAGRPTRRAAVGGKSASPYLPLMTCPSGPFMTTTAPSKDGNPGNVYDTFLVNRDFLSQDETRSYAYTEVKRLGPNKLFSDHHPVTMTIPFLV